MSEDSVTMLCFTSGVSDRVNGWTFRRYSNCFLQCEMLGLDNWEINLS